MGPRHHRTKRLLWTLLCCNAIPAAHGFRSRLRERLGRLTYKVEPPYHSQGGQDQYVNEILLKGKHAGVFAEVGANDGVNLSNTYFFERELGWTGLCVEPNPPIFEKLRSNRKARCIQACAGAEQGLVQFPKVQDAERSLYAKADQRENNAVEFVEIPRRPLNTLFEEAGLTTIDYLSIDIEGGELDVFCAIDLKRFAIDVVGLEENADALEMDRRMKSLGYRFLAKIFTDRIYRRQ